MGWDLRGINGKLLSANYPELTDKTVGISASRTRRITFYCRSLAPTFGPAAFSVVPLYAAINVSIDQHGSISQP